MKSLIASLRELTLPFGAQTGARIELDGINGEIRIYDANDDLLMQLDSDGFKIFDSLGNLRIWLAIPGGTNAAYSIVEWYTTRSDQTLPGFISLYDTVARNRMVISPGENDDRGCMEWTLVPEDADILKEAMLQAVCYTLDKADNLRPTIDLTGASSQVGKEPLTVVHNLAYGSPNAFGTSPTIDRYPGKGLVVFGSTTADTTLSTTAGTYSTIVGGDNSCDVEAGHWYRVWLAGGHSFVTGGSGFTVGDFWEFTLERRVGGGAGTWDQIPGVPALVRVRANVAVAARFPIPQVVALYQPSASASTVEFRARATKGGGAATVTSVVGTNGGSSPLQIYAEDIGTAP